MKALNTFYSRWFFITAMFSLQVRYVTKLTVLWHVHSDDFSDYSSFMPKSADISRRKIRRSIAPLNLHLQYPLECGDHLNESHFNETVVHPSLAGFIDLALKRQHNYWWTGHRPLYGTSQQAAKQLARVQSCLYLTLDYFWLLAKEHRIKRWAAHGGTAMATYCHHSANPWDDDIDITVADCGPLNKIYDNAGNVSEQYPDIPVSQIYREKTFRGRLLDQDWIIFQGDILTSRRQNNWYKLKPVSMTLSMPTGDLSGIDIMCFDLGVSRDEIGVMNSSGFHAYLVGKEKLYTTEFGPTQIQTVPEIILKKYVHDRYGKSSFCGFPFDKKGEGFMSLPSRASQMEYVVSKWYTSIQQRKSWLHQVNTTSGAELTEKAVPNLNDVEIDNTIAESSDCQIGIHGRPLTIVAFNADRGQYWKEFAKIIRATKEMNSADIVILNEMDIGMARSGNVHTTRMLAFELGMNYAWGLEFIELTNGNKEEQLGTTNMENSLGLHGNAILSTCIIYNPIITRDPLDPIYFSSEVSWVNANGYEKRLGGRMGLYAHVLTARRSHAGKAMAVVVGSVHKLHPGRLRSDILQYQSLNFSGDRIGTVVAGDFESSFCKQVGLRNLDRLPPINPTFPANCALNRSGGWRGDNICGNMIINEPDHVVLPCDTSNGTLQISDHSIVHISLQI